MASRGEEARRLDGDGQAYTRAEFISYYGGTKEWDAAPEAPLRSLPSNPVPRANNARKYAARMLKSEAQRLDAKLWDDAEALLSGHCVYLPHFFAGSGDYSALTALATDLERHTGAGGGMVSWSQHLKHENPSFSEAFRRVIQKMSDYFDVEVHATRLNFYKDGSAWKPYHHDSHAYGSNGKKEDFTMGASFGASRALSFLHEPSGATFEFPQNNGDVFAFTSTANKRFKHGVPKAKSPSRVGCRFSIIAWGTRRSINERNGGKGEVERARGRIVAGDVSTGTPPASSISSVAGPQAAHPSDPDAATKEVVVTSREVTELVEKLIALEIAREEKKIARKERVAQSAAGAAKARRVQGGGWRGMGAAAPQQRKAQDGATARPHGRKEKSSDSKGRRGRVQTRERKRNGKSGGQGQSRGRGQRRAAKKPDDGGWL